MPPAPPRAQLTLAALHLRLFAVLFDYVLIVAGLKLAEQMLLGPGWDLRPVPVSAPLLPWAWLLALAGLFVARDAAGAGPGKWIAGIAVRAAADPAQPPAPWRCLLRTASLLLLPVDLLLMLRDPFYRRLGDRWAGTVVVLREPGPSIVQRAFGLSILFLGFILAALLVTPWNLRRSAAYGEARQALLAEPLLRERVGAALELDRSPSFDLDVTPSGGTAVLTFEAKGERGRARGQVFLRLERLPVPHWERVRVEVLPTELEALRSPQVRDAPPKAQDAPRQATPR
jgi:hypothetical protein